MSTTVNDQFTEAIQAHQHGNFQHAKAIYEQILRNAPENTACLNNLGCILVMEHDYDAARKLFQQAIEMTPSFADPYNNLGNLYKAENNLNIARQYYQQALTINSEFADAHNNLATVLQNTGFVDEAIGHLKKALELNPVYTEAHNNLGYCFMLKEDYGLAIHALHEALEIDPYYDPAFYNLGLCYALQDKHLAAVGCFKQVSDRDPVLKTLSNHEMAYGQLKLCEWEGLKDLAKNIEKSTIDIWKAQPHFSLDPFIVSSMPLPLEFQTKVNQKRAEKHHASISFQPFKPRKSLHSKLRIGFISPDFNRHPISILIGQQWSFFDREKFHIYAYYTQKKIDEYTQLISSSVDIFRQLTETNHYEIAKKINEDGIDVLIDLSGFTQNSTLPVLAYRPARIQCHAFGYMGSLQAPYVDYYLADNTIVTQDIRKHFSEKIAYFPYSFSCAYPFELDEELPGRNEFALPQDKFIYCAFVSNYRIDTAILDRWCNILKATEDSILWLMIPNYLAQCNLLKYMKVRGIDPHRIIFCRDIEVNRHWGIRFADVFLDTHIVSSGTSTFLSLWMDVPVITCYGNTPQSRTSSSILKGHGYEFGICQSMDEYEEKAIYFYNHREKLSETRASLAALKLKAPTFNPEIYIDHFEQLLIQMHHNKKPKDIILDEV